ncbi:ABC transporter permease [Planctomicrobium sp. SH527]|uniref:ABC transporter permease n=1 Tax=Planctomicrobium sp. SH527 TaxID=3448123 RepID=UPI003F5BDC31
MVVEIASFNLIQGILHWLLVLVASACVALMVGLVASLAAYGSSGPRVVALTLKRGFTDLVLLAPQRILAIAILTFKEAQRRKAFMIGVLFVFLFMFAGWFLGSSSSDRIAKPFIIFVMTAMSFLLIVMALLVACWGIPADIKARSLHTVVTKPVRRSEIVLGRMLGYASVLTLILAVTATFGYFWIWQKVPAEAQNQLIARVPHYATSLEFLDRTGVSGKGLNVGDIWDYRSFIEGGTNARAIWTFENLNVAQLKNEGKLRLEQSFEAFRTYKGDVNQQLRYTLSLYNPKTKLRVPVGTYQVQEHSVNADSTTVVLDGDLVYRDTYDINAPEKKVNLFDDLIHDGKLTVEVGAVESQQYIGVAHHDMFVRMPDRTFLATYSKACLGLWLLLMLIVIIGTTSSCFVKGPVATILTSSLIFIGFVFRTRIQKILDGLAVQEGPIGGGSFESMYRLLTQMNEVSPLPDNIGTTLIKTIDKGVFGMMGIVNAMIPDLRYFNTSEYPANGFDVPWGSMLLPSIAITFAFFIPFVILGYFSLQLRELEHK